MNNKNHPNSELLLAFIDFPEEQQHQHVSVHLATCQQCRNELTILTRDIQQITADLPKLSQPASDFSHTQQLQDSLDKRLDKKSQADLLQKMEKNGSLIKAALHQATHQSAMKKGLAENNDIPKKGANNFAPMFKRAIELIRRPFQHQTSTWATAALTTSLVLMAVVISPIELHNKAQNTLVAYQDNPLVVFKKLGDNQPGIGFFSNIVTTSQPFNKVSVTLPANNTLKLNWPEIENAKSYTVQIHAINQGQWALLQEKSVTSNAATFNNFTVTNNIRYEWRITGETSDHRSFKASGGFVYDQ